MLACGVLVGLLCFVWCGNEALAPAVSFVGVCWPTRHHGTVSRAAVDLDVETFACSLFSKPEARGKEDVGRDVVSS